ncbi:uncharacterized protein J3D65DRAFT_176958 [Phyllosticta citribraziliensis]|uniref:Uncharacterized protein n=1 Tax=Phyllosticta citribraziliensis TaxID=989973 RepID=A0ABR1L1Y3_9PEZI
MRLRGTKAVEPHVAAGSRQLCLPALGVVDSTFFDQARLASRAMGVQRGSMAQRKVLDIDSTWTDARRISWKGYGTCIEDLDVTIEGEVPWQGTAYNDTRDGRSLNLETPVGIPDETEEKRLGRWLQTSHETRALRRGQRLHDERLHHKNTPAKKATYALHPTANQTREIFPAEDPSAAVSELPWTTLECGRETAMATQPRSFSFRHGTFRGDGREGTRIQQPAHFSEENEAVEKVADTHFPTQSRTNLKAVFLSLRRQTDCSKSFAIQGACLRAGISAGQRDV